MKYQPSEVAKYYDEVTPLIINNLKHDYTFQSLRPENIDDLFIHIIHIAGIKENMRILDAGCGIGGPSLFFAKQFDIKIDAINISEVQVKLFQEKVIKNGLNDKINIVHGDYHHLEEYFSADSYDLILFLESFGHSNEPEKLLKLSWNLLKKGGKLYIKDPFKVKTLNIFKKIKINFMIKQNARHYKFNFLTIDKITKILKKCNFKIEHSELVSTVNLDSDPITQYEILVAFKFNRLAEPIHYADSYEILSSK